jgi:hypothetical protein
MDGCDAGRMKPAPHAGPINASGRLALRMELVLWGFVGFCGVTPPSQMPLLDEQERSHRKATRGIGGEGGRGRGGIAPAPHRPEQTQRQECTARSFCLECVGVGRGGNSKKSRDAVA